MNSIETLHASADALPVGFRPIGGRVLIRPDKVSDLTRGGLILAPATVAALQKRADTGVVLAMGPGMLMKNGARWPIDVKVGDRVYFQREGALEIELGGEPVLSVRDEFLLAEHLP